MAIASLNSSLKQASWLYTGSTYTNKTKLYVQLCNYLYVQNSLLLTIHIYISYHKQPATVAVCIATYSTNHPQLKQYTCVCAAYANAKTCVALNHVCTRVCKIKCNAHVQQLFVTKQSSLRLVLTITRHVYMYKRSQCIATYILSAPVPFCIVFACTYIGS